MSGVTITMGYNEELISDGAGGYRDPLPSDMTFTEPVGGFQIDCGDQLRGDWRYDYCEIPSAYGQYQWVIITLPTPMMIESVQLRSEYFTLQGKYRFEVDGVQCPENQYSIEASTWGGPFNCGLEGSQFKLYCEEICEPSLSINKLMLYNEKLIALDPGTTIWPSSFGMVSLAPSVV